MGTPGCGHTGTVDVGAVNGGEVDRTSADCGQQTGGRVLIELGDPGTTDTAPHIGDGEEGLVTQFLILD